MTKSFSVLHEQWLPVRIRDRQVTKVGLLELFQQANRITGLAETDPASLMAQYRILLAILHRALTMSQPGWDDESRVNLFTQDSGLEFVCDYLQHWEDRFWLHHPEYPFLQVAALAHAEETRDKRKSWTQISLASSSGNAPAVFNHAYDAELSAIAPGQALRHLLGFLQFTPAGLVKVIRSADKAGALVNTAAVLPLGKNLKETLLLALHPITAKEHEDVPCWEQPPLSTQKLAGGPYLATGPNDRYTRLSRAVLFLPEHNGDIKELHFAVGCALDEDLNAPDPMASYRMGANKLIRITFTHGRSFWRDLPALMPDNGKRGSVQAAVLTHATNLHRLVSFFEAAHQPLLVAGIASDQAKLLRWRVEYFSLPVQLIEDIGEAELLCQLIAGAESFFADWRHIANIMLAQMLPDPGSKETRARGRDIFANSGATARYFSHAERSLAEVMNTLIQDGYDAAETLWKRALRDAAEQAWVSVREQMGSSAQALRADAVNSPRFLGLLKKWQAETLLKSD